MAVGATGTPTVNFSIPRFATGADAPNGSGFNSAMDFIDNLLKEAPMSSKITGLVDGDAVVWDTTTGTWVRVTGTKDGTKFLRDDGTWASSPTPTQVSMNGTPRKINVGTGLITFSASAQSANPGPDIAHGLGVAPVAIVLLPVDTHINMTIQSGGTTSTNFKPLGQTNDLAAITATVGFQWIAVG